MSIVNRDFFSTIVVPEFGISTLRLRGEVKPIEEPEWERIIRKIMESSPEKTHFRVGDNVSACTRGGDRTQIQNWGEYLTNDKSLVGCQPCLEWLHS